MRSRGFTLVEILVVVIIMALVISLAILSIHTTGKDTQLDEESRRLEGLLGILHEKAILESRDFGMRVEPTSYEFLVYDVPHDRWVTFDQQREFRHRDLPKGLHFQLELDSQVVVLKAIDRTMTGAADLPRPQVAVAGSGECTPFRLTLLRDETDAKASVAGEALGKLTRTGTDGRTDAEPPASAASAAGGRS